MNRIRWIESKIERSLAARLDAYDHHRIDIDGSAAVLITYVHAANPDRGLLAVLHPAADQHPPAPDWVREILADVTWLPCEPPSV